MIILITLILFMTGLSIASAPKIRTKISPTSTSNLYKRTINVPIYDTSDSSRMIQPESMAKAKKQPLKYKLQECMEEAERLIRTREFHKPLTQTFGPFMNLFPKFLDAVLRSLGEEKFTSLKKAGLFSNMFVPLCFIALPLYVKHKVYLDAIVNFMDKNKKINTFNADEYIKDHECSFELQIPKITIDFLNSIAPDFAKWLKCFLDNFFDLEDPNKFLEDIANQGIIYSIYSSNILELLLRNLLIKIIQEKLSYIEQGIF